MAEEKSVMQNIDIKNFGIVQTLNDGDYVVVSLSDGVSRRVKVALLKTLFTEKIAPNIKDGVWYVGDKNLNVSAEGKTPEFRKTSLGLEYKYTSEGESAWRLLVPVEDFLFDFDDMTEANIAELQKPAKEMITVLEKTNKDIQSSEEIRKAAETVRNSNEKTRILEETGRVSSENIRVSNEDNRRKAETQRENVKNEMIDLNQELKNHPPKINVIYNWEVWDATLKRYVDTGVTGQGKTPIIRDGIWYIWDSNQNMYVSTGWAVNSDFQLTKEAVDGVLGGSPTIYIEEWKHTHAPYKKGVEVKFNQEFFIALKDTELPPVDLVVMGDGVIAKIDEHTYATVGSYDAAGNKEDWKKIPYDQLRLVSREGTLNGNPVDVRNLTGEEVYQFEPNLYIDLQKGEIKGVGVLKMNNNNVIYI